MFRYCCTLPSPRFPRGARAELRLEYQGVIAAPLCFSLLLPRPHPNAACARGSRRQLRLPRAPTPRARANSTVKIIVVPLQRCLERHLEEIDQLLAVLRVWSPAKSLQDTDSEKIALPWERSAVSLHLRKARWRLGGREIGKQGRRKRERRQGGGGKGGRDFTLRYVSSDF